MQFVRAAVLCFFVLIPGIALAQSAPAVRVHGIAYDSLHKSVLPGAFVVLSPGNRSATSDDRGRFVFDSVLPGNYRLVMQHDALDSLGMSGAASRVTITDGRDTVVVAVPSFSALWRASCHSQPPSADSGFVFGTIRSTATSARSAKVTATWIDAGFDRSSGVTTKRWRLEALADSSGNYVLCGVPTQTGISVHAATDSGATGAFDLLPLDKERVRRRDLTLIATATGTATQRKGAILTGSVLVDSVKTPLANVEVALSDIGLTATTDTKGAFTIGDIPAGTHSVQARRLGYAASVVSVDFAEGASIDRTILMNRVTTLDSVNVKASSAPRDLMAESFADHVKRGFGKFYDSDALRKAEGRTLAALMAQTNGVGVVPGRANEAWVMSTRAPQPPAYECGKILPLQQRKDGNTQFEKQRACFSQNGWFLPNETETESGIQIACYARVYVDRLIMNGFSEPFDLNSMTISQIERIEWYSGKSDTPPEYLARKAPCGVMVIHSRRY